MKYGFIGLGNMASAIIEGIHANESFCNDKILGINRSYAKTERLAAHCGLIPMASIQELVATADTVILAVKPQILPDVLPEVSKALRKEQLVISIAAGKSLAWYAACLPPETPVVRVMPNICAKVGCAVTGICGNKYVTEDQLRIADSIFSSVGKVFHITEDLFPAISSIGGASGAFALLYIDALAAAGVKAGFPRPMAEELAAAVTKGAATLLEQSAEHPSSLIDQICSPGGTTIEGVMKLKELGFESAVHQAAQAVIDKDRKL